MDYFLIGIVISLVAMKFIDEIWKLVYVRRYLTKNKPKKATECEFCVAKKNNYNVLSELRCIHPYGMDLNNEVDPLNCVMHCKYATSNNDKVSDAGLLQLIGVKRYILRIALDSLVIVIPSIIALYRILGN